MRDYSYLNEHIDVRGADYWIADVLSNETGLSVLHYTNPDDASEGITTTRIAWPNLAAALWVMSEGAYVNFDGTMGELSHYHSIAARYLLSGPTWAADDADADTDTWDIALQLAVLGRVLYS